MFNTTGICMVSNNWTFINYCLYLEKVKTLAVISYIAKERGG